MSVLLQKGVLRMLRALAMVCMCAGSCVCVCVCALQLCQALSARLLQVFLWIGFFASASSDSTTTVHTVLSPGSASTACLAASMLKQKSSAAPQACSVCTTALRPLWQV